MLRCTNKAIVLMLTSAALVATSDAALAGSADAGLTCSSLKKKAGYKLAGVIPRDSDSFKLTLSSKSGKTRVWKQYPKLVIFSHITDHLLAFNSQEAGGLTFWALPKTMRVKKKGTHNQYARFKAKLRTPRLDRPDMLMTIALRCRYIYEI